MARFIFVMLIASTMLFPNAISEEKVQVAAKTTVADFQIKSTTEVAMGSRLDKGQPTGAASGWKLESTIPSDLQKVLTKINAGSTPKPCPEITRLLADTLAELDQLNDTDVILAICSKSLSELESVPPDWSTCANNNATVHQYEQVRKVCTDFPEVTFHQRKPGVSDGPQRSEGGGDGRMADEEAAVNVNDDLHLPNGAASHRRHSAVVCLAAYGMLMLAIARIGFA